MKNHFSSKWLNTIPFLFITELGTGWAPAVADTSVELNNIDRGQKQLSNDRSFWIGGSTNEPATDDIAMDYSKYVSGESGKPYILHLFTCVHSHLKQSMIHSCCK